MGKTLGDHKLTLGINFKGTVTLPCVNYHLLFRVKDNHHDTLLINDLKETPQVLSGGDYSLVSWYFAHGQKKTVFHIVIYLFLLLHFLIWIQPQIYLQLWNSKIWTYIA